MPPQEKELNADGYLKRLLEKEGVAGYIVFSQDGIPMRYAGKGISHKKAVHYSALITDYWQIVTKTLNNTLAKVLRSGEENSSDNDIEYIRLRTKNQTELIITSHNGFFIVCI